jgi:hypothetical protein
MGERQIMQLMGILATLELGVAIRDRHDAVRELGVECEHAFPGHSSPQHHHAAGIQATNAATVLAKVDPSTAIAALLMLRSSVPRARLRSGEWLAVHEDTDRQRTGSS